MKLSNFNEEVFLGVDPRFGKTGHLPLSIRSFSYLELGVLSCPLKVILLGQQGIRML